MMAPSFVGVAPRLGKVAIARSICSISAGDFVARSEQLRLTINGRYVYGDNANTLIARNARGTIKLDFFVTKRFFWFASAYFENDRFQDLKMRTALASGPGYQIVDRDDFSGILKDMTLYAEAGVASPKVARFAALHDLEGGEFLAGIPGSVGGALAMNAGCYGGETWDIVERVLTIDRGGRTFERARDEFEIGYRHCAPATPREEWFAAAWFRLPPGDGATSRGIIKELLARRIATQPLSLPNAGSVFRNPDRDHAARLIESCGLKGFGRGGARVSEKHANFIVNPEGAASAADIEWLIQHVQRMVYQMKGVVLTTEVRIVGAPA